MRRRLIFSHDSRINRGRGLKYIEVYTTVSQETGIAIFVASDTDDLFKDISESAAEGRTFVGRQKNCVACMGSEGEFGKVQSF